MYDTVHNMSRALASGQKEGSQAQEGVLGASVLKSKVSGRLWGYLLRDGVCLSLELLAEAVQRAEAALPLEKLFGKVLCRVWRVERLEPFAKGVRE